MSSWNFIIPLLESQRRVTDTEQVNPQFNKYLLVLWLVVQSFYWSKEFSTSPGLVDYR